MDDDEIRVGVWILSVLVLCFLMLIMASSVFRYVIFVPALLYLVVLTWRFG